MLLLILKSFRFCLLKGYCLPPLHKAKILLGCLLSTEVNDCDIINSHKKCRAGLFIYNKAVTVKKFSLPITSAVLPLFFLFPNILSFLSDERSKCCAFRDLAWHVSTWSVAWYYDPMLLLCQSMAVASFASREALPCLQALNS